MRDVVKTMKLCCFSSRVTTDGTKPSQHMSSFPYVAHRVPLGFVSNEQRVVAHGQRKHGDWLLSPMLEQSWLVCVSKKCEMMIYVCVKCLRFSGAMYFLLPNPGAKREVTCSKITVILANPVG
jgi:hypothetical protein